MTVLSFEFIHSGWHGKAAHGVPIQDFQVQGLVKTDDRDDGPQQVLDYSGTPDLGDSYAVGNDSDTTVKLKEIKPTRIGGKLWQVILVYGDPSKKDEDQQDSNQSGVNDAGVPQDDPANDAQAVDIFTVNYSKALQKATFLGSNAPGDIGISGLFHQFFANKKIAVQNTALGVFDPPDEIEDNRLGVRVRRFHQVFPAGHVNYQLRVNNDQFSIVRTWGLNLTFPQRTCLMVSITSSYRLRGENGAWYTDYEFHYDLDGWDREYLDLGFKQRQWTDNTDAKTGATIQTSKPEGAVFKDASGTPLTEPTKLNGEGEALTQAQIATLQAKGTDGIYLKYRVFKEDAFAALNL